MQSQKELLNDPATMQDFDRVCMLATRGRLNPHLFPKDYEYVLEFESAFRHVAAKFDEPAKDKLRVSLLKQGLRVDIREKKILVRLLGCVMDECERRGFQWPRSVLRIKSEITREIAELQEEAAAGK